MTTIDEVADVADRAVRAAGEYLRAEYDDGNDDGDYGAHDVTAAVDHGAEERILDVLGEAFPDHAVTTEESGHHDGSGYRWVVDPLDGTNNFTAGLPTFTSTVAALEDGDPAVAAVYVPVLEDIYLARRDGGVTYNGDPVRADSRADTDTATVGFVIGHDVKLDPERAVVADGIRSTLEVTVKRVIPTWCPSLYWALLSRGRIDGMVAYHPDAIEQHAGELLATESGARTDGTDGVYVAAANDRVFEFLWDTTEPVR